MTIGFYHPEGLIGREIAGYELTDFLDSGAASLVFRGKRANDTLAPHTNAENTSPLYPEVAAIKLLAPSLSARDDEVAEFQRRFEREADVLKRLAHPYILSAIDSGEDVNAGYFYLLLPFMEGGSLASVLADRGPLPLPEVASMLARLADALDFAHNRGIIHRDVKPANILLDTQSEPYLSDFGIARLLYTDMTQRTTLGRVIGSPIYMAPEQFTDTNKIGPLSDLYGLGMVVYQMVTGHAAFESDSWLALIHKQINEVPVSPRYDQPDLPEPAAAAILNALEKDPTRRFASASAFAKTFARGLQDEWADDLMEYMPSATKSVYAMSALATPADSIAASSAPSNAPVASSQDASSDAPTWPDGASVIGAPNNHQAHAAWGGEAWDDARWARARWDNSGRGVAVAAAFLLVITGLVGWVLLIVGGSAGAPTPPTAASTGSHVAHIQDAQSIATNTPIPQPAATKSHSGSKGHGKHGKTGAFTISTTTALVLTPAPQASS